ncbi:MAG: DUF1552 domain-containing protein [Verrucomicrobiota bacterium]|nr:DUF1552 domain-containing protein [Verrucomicrobiota bacterium]
MKSPVQTRRAFLRSTTALIALPALESLGFRRFASAAALIARPKRMLFFGFGYGVTKETWYPKQDDTGPGFTLPAGLQPLERHRRDITVIQGLMNKFSNDAHWGSTFYLTGANRYSEPGQSFHNSISADQVAAEVLGKETRFTSIHLGCAKADGHGPGLSLAWNRQGKPVGGFDNPLQAYHRLFADDQTSLAQRQTMLRQRRSILDTVLADAGSLQRDLTKLDQEKLDEYFQSIREIETRIGKEEQWLGVPKARPASALQEPAGEVAGYQEIKLMYDLMVAALQSDATRVITYRQPVGTLLPSLGVRMSAHTMSHYDPGPRMEASQLRDQKQSELLAYLIDKLKAAKEPDGSSLFDHTVLSYGSNISSRHDLFNCPTIISGGGAGLKLGHHLVLADPKTPLCNLWLTLLQRVGVPVESHGDSSGTIKELLS